jgi:hypothetical protein
MAQQPTKRKLYRTMQGRMVDIEKLRSSNEGVRAVGNMGVNSRGDVVGAGGQIVKTKEQLMKEYYDAPKGKVSDTRVKRVNEVASQPQPQPQAQNTQNDKPVVQARKTDMFKPKKGIDAALDGIE